MHFKLIKMIFVNYYKVFVCKFYTENDNIFLLYTNRNTTAIAIYSTNFTTTTSTFTTNINVTDKDNNNNNNNT
jgi:hypothetical protein